MYENRKSRKYYKFVSFIYFKPRLSLPPSPLLLPLLPSSSSPSPLPLGASKQVFSLKFIIDVFLIIFRTVCLTTAQILSILKEDQPSEPTGIVLLPSDENNVSDEDNDVEGGLKHPNHIGSQLMNHQAEIVKQLRRQQ